MQSNKTRKLLDYNQLAQSFPRMREHNPMQDIPNNFFPNGFLLPDETMVAVAETQDLYSCLKFPKFVSIKCTRALCCKKYDEPVMILTSHRLILHSHYKHVWQSCFPLGKILKYVGFCVPYFKDTYRNWLVCDLSRITGVGFAGGADTSNETCPCICG